MLWNSLSEEMKNTTIETFKKHLKYKRKKINTISFTKGTGQLLKKILILLLDFDLTLIETTEVG